MRKTDKGYSKGNKAKKKVPFLPVGRQRRPRPDDLTFEELRRQAWGDPQEKEERIVDRWWREGLKKAGIDYTNDQFSK